MLGRGPETQWLERNLRVSAEELPRLVLLEGPLGFGKSALLRSVVAHLDQPVSLMRGDRFLDTETPLATARPLIEQAFDADLEHVVEEHSFAAVQRRCRRHLARVPRLLVIDDAQWIDPRSQHLLGTVIGDAAVVVLAYRPGMAPTELIDAARTAGNSVDHLSLGPLEPSDVARLAADLPRRQQRVVVDTAEGSPLYARTLASAFRNAPDAVSLEDLLGTDEGIASDALSSVVGADVRGLEPGPRRTLTAVAVLGTARTDHLEALTGREDVADDLRLLRRRGLLTVAGAEPLHPLVRHTVYSRADLALRVEMHRRAAGLPGTDAFVRAGHLSFLRSDATAREVDAILAAAEQSLDTDPQVVDRWLSAVDHLGSARRDVLWARAQVMLGRPEQAMDVLRTLIRDPERGVEARVLLAQALRMSGEAAEAHEVLTAREAPRRPELLFELATTSVFFDRAGAREAAVRDLLAGPEPFAGAARALRAIGALGTGDVAAARDHFAGVSETLLAMPPEDLRDVLEAVAAAAWCAYMLDEFQVGIDLAERGLRVARRFGRAPTQPNLGCALAFSLIQVGRLDDADAAALDAAEAGRLFRVPDSIAMARCALVLSAFWQHRDDLMRVRARDLRAAPVPVVPWWRRTVESTLARTLAMLGEPIPHVLEREPSDAMTPLRFADAATIAMYTGRADAAAELLREGHELARCHRLVSQSAFLGMLRAGVVAHEDPDLAVELWEHCVTTYERLGMPGHLRMATRQLEDFRARRRTAASAALTAREREVVQHVVNGASNQEIADQLCLSRRTVEEHVSNILRKLGVRSRHHVAAAL